MESILPLSMAHKLPHPVLKPAAFDSASEEVAAEGASPRAVSAAYQALPVTASSLITHNITPALPVLDADELDKEVRLPACLAAAGRQRPWPPLHWHAGRACSGPAPSHEAPPGGARPPRFLQR